MKFKLAAALAIPAFLAGCETIPDDETAWTSPAQGLLLAEDNCSSCHAVRRTGESPNEDATEFVEIANLGMSEEGLAEWLTDSHNFPADMGFALSDTQAQGLAAYIVTLRSGD